ncbi:PREDICTED: J domain-containing protein required for chloroplast accumulation response 1, partial [Tarenaya hassleriana]
PDSLPKPSFSGGLEAREANIKPIHSFFANDKQGEYVIANEESREGKSRAKNARPSNGDSKSRKKPQGQRSSSDRTKIEKPSFPSSSSKTEEVNGDRVKGKVKEFIKVFSQGASIGTDGESLGQSFRWRAKENTAGTDLNKTIDEQQKPNSDSTAMDQHPPQVREKKDSDMENMESGTHGVSGQERRQEQSTEHNVHEDTDEPFDLNFQVKEITQDEDKPEKSGDDADEIQIIDAKIRKWSQGKDGNIRSLLSTLQYILWPGSGWKPVPLMDMIEANAVRRSYQRALLILHPDKLQQKGASSDHKYIAESVFELLQEAWDFFNSVGPI